MTSTVTNNIVKNARSLSKDGIWFRDPEGRYLLFRGVNFASRSKLPPFLPIAPLHMQNIDESILKEEIELVKPELDLLKKLGFNIIRLLISWKAIEPEPNPNLNELSTAGRKYLNLVNQIIDALYSRDLFILLDFHQDIAHEIYGGDGFPDWALAIDEQHKRPKASNLRDRKWQTAYMLNKLVKHTLSSFWKNDLTNTEFGLQNFPVRTHLEKTIGQTVNFFRSLNNGSGHPAILGIEPFNEPHPAGIAAEQFEETFLYQYYQNVESEIRKFDDKIFLFLEPRVDWTMSFQGAGEKKSKVGPTPFNIRRTFHLNFLRDAMIEGNIDPQAGQQIVSYLPSDSMSLDKIRQRGVFSFHYYDPIAITQSFLKIPDNMYRYVHQWGDIFSQLVKAAEKRELVPFMTEFGGVQDAELIRDYIDLHYKQIETFLLNSTYWNYDLYNTKDGKDNWNLENFSLLGPDRSPR
ncbi:MAG: cellulase family glycosylhydrolase, partial [Nitrososphaeraceae archaeon]